MLLPRYHTTVSIFETSLLISRFGWFLKGFAQTPHFDTFLSTFNAFRQLWMLYAKFPPRRWFWARWIWAKWRAVHSTDTLLYMTIDAVCNLQWKRTLSVPLTREAKAKQMTWRKFAANHEKTQRSIAFLWARKNLLHASSVCCRFAADLLLICCALAAPVRGSLMSLWYPPHTLLKYMCKIPTRRWLYRNLADAVDL